jgi:putative transcriptional regulator
MPTKSSLEALFGPRARTRDIDRVTSGSPGKFSLKPEPRFFRTVDAAVALARRSVRMTVAKHAVERLMAGHAVAVEVPVVESREAFATELAGLGVTAEEIRATTGADLARLRERLALSQEQFASTYTQELRTLQNWEQGRNALDAQASLLVKALDRYPELMASVAADED